MKDFSKTLSAEQIVLEIGCGRGYFKPLFENYLGTDIKLTGASDFCCDLTQANPIKPESIDILLMNNLLEHVFEFDPLLSASFAILKPNGVLAIAVPFTGGIHYVPHDYWRYTHFGLAELARKHRFEIQRLEAVCHPYKLVADMIKYLEKKISQKNALIQFTLRSLKFHLRVLQKFSQAHCNEFGNIENLPLHVTDPSEIPLFALGYHAIFLKK